MAEQHFDVWTSGAAYEGYWAGGAGSSHGSS